MAPIVIPVAVRSWPARFTIYYGWVNVCVAAVAMSATLPGRTYGLAFIKESSSTDLGITDLGFSYFNFWAIILGSILCIPTGQLIDRFGTRRVLAAVCVLLGGVVVLMSRAQDQVQFFLTLVGVRGLGQGALSVVAIALVGKWFRRRAGAAMGLFAILLGIGFIGPIMALDALVKDYGWRQAWELTGITIGCGVGLVGGLLARSSPEAYGVPPDESPDQRTSVPPLTALKTWGFWVFSLSAAFFNFIFSAGTLNISSLLQEQHLNPEATMKVFQPLLLSGLLANGLAGAVIRRGRMGPTLAFGMAGVAVSLGLFPFVRDEAGVIAFAVLLGAGGGVITVVYFAVYGEAYGRGHLGVIQATVQVLTVLASASGPVVLSLCQEFGRAVEFFYVCGAIALGLAVAAWFTRPELPARN